MSDTPRTDKYLSFNPTETEEERHLAEFARELETENAALLDALEDCQHFFKNALAYGSIIEHDVSKAIYAQDKAIDAIAKAKGGQDE